MKRGRPDLIGRNCMREKEEEGSMAFPFRGENRDYVD
jgi:hypothetical protein